MGCKSSRNRFYKSTCLALPVLGLALGGGWVADGLTPLTQLAPPTWNALLPGLAIFFYSAYRLYIDRHAYLPVRLLSKSERVDPHRALIIPVSKEADPKLWQELPADLDEAIQQNDRRIKWLQILRTLHPHRERLQEIHLIGSDGDRGSFAQLDDCRDCIERYFPKVKVAKYPRAIAFENIDDITDTVDKLIRELEPRIPIEQIMLDATGGTKTMSIAMAMATLHHPKLQFQYVTTDETPRPIAFNVVAEREELE